MNETIRPQPAEAKTEAPTPGWTLRGANAGAEESRFAAWFGRIGTRAVLIALLMLGTVGLLTGTALFVGAQQAAIIDHMGIGDRHADAVADEFASQVAGVTSGFASIIAGVLHPAAGASRMAHSAENLASSFAQLEDALGDEIDPLVLGGGRDMMARLPEFMTRVIDALTARRRADFGPLHEEWLDFASTFNGIAAAARNAVHDRTDATLAQAHALTRQAFRVVVAAGLVGLLGSGLIWYVLVGLIARPISRVAQSMDSLAHGDIQAEVPGAERSDQVGAMARAVLVFRDTAQAQRRLTDSAMENARRTAIATNQASEAIGQVSDGALTQLSELRQVVEALSQSADAIRDVGGSTQDANDRAAEARVLLSESVEKVHRLIELVDAVGDDTERVTRIARNIAKIATQTNILAIINAAIEAARAGEHGRGLAVVAEEVRALAVSSEQLAQEIADVVEVAGDRTRQGSGTAAAVGEAMDSLTHLVAESARLAALIAVAMEEQQSTVTGIEERVTTLSRIGQSNATAAEEITVTMIDLSRLATETRSAVETMARGQRA